MEIERLPRVGAAAVVRKGDLYLLIRRDKEPNKGKWVFPGGGIKFMEERPTTAKRETKEETGVEIKVTEFIAPYDIIKTDEHRIIFFYRADHVSGEPHASSDASDAKFMHPREILALVRQGAVSEITQKVLSDINLI